jgi:hypothetical protein
MRPRITRGTLFATQARFTADGSPASSRIAADGMVGQGIAAMKRTLEGF